MDNVSRYWEENATNMQQRVKFERCLTNEESVPRMKDTDRTIYSCCDSNLNFSTATCSEDDCEYGPYKKSTKVARQDPMSHRIIEKRRRDRMNNCLADLSRLIPTEYLKKGRGRIEKTEIIEMAIKHMKHLQQAQERDGGSPMDHYRLGYQECMSEAMRFLVEIEGHFPREPICVRMLNHLQHYGEQLAKGPPASFSASSPTSTIEPVPTLPAQVPTMLLKNVNNNNNQKLVNIAEFTVPKAEPENSNSCDSHAFVFKSSEKSDEFGNSGGVFALTSPSPDKSEEFGNTGGLYKFKNSIKMRFSQDLSAHEVPKRLKLRGERRRGSVTSCCENQSSNLSSPPSSAEPPCHNSVSDLTDLNHNHQRQTPPPDHNRSAVKLHDPGEPQPSPKSNQNYIQHANFNAQDNYVNFNVPIFVLHTKGSYYLPLTIDYKTLKPYLRGCDILESNSVGKNVILHPVTLNVNFLFNNNNFNGF